MTGLERTARRGRSRVLLVIAVLIALCVVGGVALHPWSNATPARIRRAWLIVMENRADTSILHSRSAPYLNSLITRFGLAANYTALVHSSQPNYIALFSGRLHGVAGNAVVSIQSSNVADQLEAAGDTWRVYAQNVPSGCYTGETATGGTDGPGTYARKHEPAISFADISSSPERCGNILPFSSFDPEAANFELIVPNLENDMHNGTTLQGDTFLRGFVPRILASAAWASGSPLFITWDEGKPASTNHILTLVISPAVPSGFRSEVPHTHYSLLRTIEEWFHIPCLAQACQANALNEFFPAAAHLGAAPNASP